MRHNEVESFEAIERGQSELILVARSIAIMNTHFDLKVPTAKERCCLKCETKFLSKVGNRICLECKSNPLHNFYGESL